jgi:uncharacterized protein YacL
MNRSLWTIRILFLLLCLLGGYAVSQVQPDIFSTAWTGSLAGLGFGCLLILIDELLKGFSLRAFSAATFGLVLGTLIAWMLDSSQLFIYADEKPTRWLIRLCLFLSFGYIGMVLAMRSNKEDFSLLIPYVRFSSRHRAETPLLLDTSAIIDGRVAELLETSFLDGVIILPRFVLHELQQIADAGDPIRRARGRRGLDTLSRIQRNPHREVRIHEAEIPDEREVDAKLLHLTATLGGKLFTTDYNLAKIAELQGLSCINIDELAKCLKALVLPGETLSLKIVREGKDKGQGIGYLNDGTMVVVSQAQNLIGQQVNVQVQSLLQTGAGVIVFADLKTTNASLNFA